MPRFPGGVSIETEYEERIHMIAIRMIIEIIIFIVMMGMSIKIRQNKIKRTRKITLIRIFGTIMFLVIVPYVGAFPVENLFITFKSPEQALAYEVWPMSKIKVDKIIEGEESCLVIEKKEKHGNIRYETEYFKKVPDGYKFPGNHDVKAKNITGTSLIVEYVKGTKDYYLSGVKMTECADDIVDIKDNLGTSFIQTSEKVGHYKDIEAYDQAYYGYMYDITNDYKIYLEGQTYELPFDVDSFSN